MLATAALALAACDNDEVDKFSSDAAGIYFQYGIQTRLFINSEQYTDSSSFSFSNVNDDVMQYVLTTTVKTLGNVAPYDRAVKVVVDDANTTAVAGTDYEANLDTVTIKAGESSATISVRFLRTAKLMNNRVRLVLRLQPNDNFTIPFTRQKNTNVYNASGDTINADRFDFIVSEIYTQPSYWSFAQDYFGAWSVSKFRYINRICGIPNADWQRGGYSDSKVQGGRFPIYVYQVRNALQEAADNGTPVRDDDGSYMQLGPNYQVDYSAYVNTNQNSIQ